MRQSALQAVASVTFVAVIFAWTGQTALAFPVSSGGMLAPGSPAVVSGWDGHDWEIFQIDGGLKTQLTDNDFDDQYPRRRGSSIVWQGRDDGDWEVFHFDGSDIAQLTDDGVDQISAHFFGSLVRWQGWDGNDWEVFQFDGTEITNLTNNSSDDRVILSSEDPVFLPPVTTGSAIGAPEPAAVILLGIGSMLLVLQRRSRGRNTIVG